MRSKEKIQITEEQVEQWGNGTLRNHALSWFAEVLNGEMSVAEARENCLSIVRGDNYEKCEDCGFPIESDFAKCIECELKQQTTEEGK